MLAGASRDGPGPRTTTRRSSEWAPSSSTTRAAGAHLGRHDKQRRPRPGEGDVTRRARPTREVNDHQVAAAATGLEQRLHRWRRYATLPQALPATREHRHLPHRRQRTGQSAARQSTVEPGELPPPKSWCALHPQRQIHSPTEWVSVDQHGAQAGAQAGQTQRERKHGGPGPSPPADHHRDLSSASRSVEQGREPIKQPGLCIRQKQHLLGRQLDATSPRPAILSIRAHQEYPLPARQLPTRAKGSRLLGQIRAHHD